MNENEQNAPDVMGHLARLSRMVRRRPTKKDRRLSHGWARLLAVVMEEDGIRASELAGRLDIRPSSLSELLKKMEDEGYFVRVRDAADSRVVHIHATEEGRAEYARRDTEKQDFSGLLRAGLTDEEALTFCRLCDKLCAHLEKEFPPEAQAAAGHGHGGGRPYPKGHMRPEDEGRPGGPGHPEARPAAHDRPDTRARRGHHGGSSL